MVTSTHEAWAALRQAVTIPGVTFWWHMTQVLAPKYTALLAGRPDRVMSTPAVVTPAAANTALLVSPGRNPEAVALTNTGPGGTPAIVNVPSCPDVEQSDEPSMHT